MKEIIIYESYDGKQFNTKNDCITYEKMCSIETLELKYKFDRNKWFEKLKLNKDDLLSDIANSLCEINKSCKFNKIEEINIVLEGIINWLYTASIKREEFRIEVEKEKQKVLEQSNRESWEATHDNDWQEHWP